MKPILVALMFAVATVASSCGRDDRQEKVGAKAAAGDPVSMPDGTKTGGRTTAPPK